MPGRPSYRRKRGIRRGRFGEWPSELDPPDVVANRVSYGGNPVHKTYESPAGPPANYSDKTRCREYTRRQWPKLVEALRAAIRARAVSGLRGTFPARAWVWIDGVLHEARLHNQELGEYHGFPIDDPSQYPEPKSRLEQIPHVEIHGL